VLWEGLKGGVFGLVLGLFAGFLARRGLVALLTGAAGSGALSYDPQQTISRMIELQVFAWMSLAWMTPGVAGRRKYRIAASGTAGAFLFFAVSVSAIEVFELRPHVGLLKLGIVLLPFLGYLLLFRAGLLPAPSPAISDAGAADEGPRSSLGPCES
jgi:hypothetical protein